MKRTEWGEKYGLNSIIQRIRFIYRNIIISEYNIVLKLGLLKQKKKKKVNDLKRKRNS